jgi:hypothetical protein
MMPCRRAQPSAAELVALKVDVIVASGTLAALGHAQAAQAWLVAASCAGFGLPLSPRPDHRAPSFYVLFFFAFFNPFNLTARISAERSAASIPSQRARPAFAAPLEVPSLRNATAAGFFRLRPMAALLHL